MGFSADLQFGALPASMIRRTRFFNSRSIPNVVDDNPRTGADVDTVEVLQFLDCFNGEEESSCGLS
tara:strand:- start:129 stop:326 length:198 start_codon:yes stop_codon:yes gene_type:complete